MVHLTDANPSPAAYIAELAALRASRTRGNPPVGMTRDDFVQETIARALTAWSTRRTSDEEIVCFEAFANWLVSTAMRHAGERRPERVGPLGVASSYGGEAGGHSGAYFDAELFERDGEAACAPSPDANLRRGEEVEEAWGRVARALRCHAAPGAARCAIELHAPHRLDQGWVDRAKSERRGGGGGGSHSDSERRQADRAIREAAAAYRSPPGPA